VSARRRAAIQLADAKPSIAGPAARERDVVVQQKEYDVVHVPLPPVTAAWKKSSASGTGACVEVARTAEFVWVRDSKDPDGPALGFTRPEWDAFLAGAQRGEFDCPPPAA
jgi:hypothetical protein